MTKFFILELEIVKPHSDILGTEKKQKIPIRSSCCILLLATAHMCFVCRVSYHAIAPRTDGNGKKNEKQVSPPPRLATPPLEAETRKKITRRWRGKKTQVHGTNRRVSRAPCRRQKREAAVCPPGGATGGRAVTTRTRACFRAAYIRKRPFTMAS